MSQYSKNISRYFVKPTSTIRDVMVVIDKTSGGIALVIDENQFLLGTVTDGDVRRAMLANISFEETIQIILDKKKKTIYSKPITGIPNQDKPSYLKILKEHNLIHLPLIDEKNRVVDLVTLDDLTSEVGQGIRAVVMAGGAGKRLQPLTLDTPKPMLQVGDKPLLEIILDRLKQAGVKKVNITTHYLKDKITDHFQSAMPKDVDLSFISEESPMGTAGALRFIEASDETILVMNGDILTDLDFRVMLNYHRESKADLTIAVRQYDFKVPYGVVECDGHSVKSISEKPVYNFFVNAGIYLLEPRVLNFIPKNNEKFDMTDLISCLINNKKPIVSFPILEQWIDIGQPNDYALAQQLIVAMEKKQ
ncbi:MAG: nucleotidyltransferase family protein [Elusimicrobiota bacterium]